MLSCAILSGFIRKFLTSDKNRKRAKLDYASHLGIPIDSSNNLFIHPPPIFRLLHRHLVNRIPPDFCHGNNRKPADADEQEILEHLFCFDFGKRDRPR